MRIQGLLRRTICTTQLVNKLSKLVVKLEIILVTVDVKSLYTCIPHEESIQACAEALKLFQEKNPDQPDTETLVNHIQLQGKAMGTKLAPAYTNIFMGKLEESVISSAPLKPSHYKCYIDDILILWPHSETALDSFISSLNNFHPTIKFTSDINHQK